MSITGTSYNNALYKGPTNGWTSEKQTSVDKNALALISGEIFQASFRQGMTMSTFILSRDELSKKGIDLSNGLDFYGEKLFSLFNFGV